MELSNKEVSYMIPEKKNQLTIEEHEAIQNQYPDMTVEYYDGEIIMSSHTSNMHNEIVGNIFAALKPFFKGTNCKVRHEQIEVILGYDTDNKEFVFPDVFVACDKKLKGESYIETPQIIFEVVSNDYRDNDYIRKLKLYQRHKALEYIIVDPYRKDITHYYMDGESFRLATDDNYVSKVFTGLSLSLEDIFEA